MRLDPTQVTQHGNRRSMVPRAGLDGPSLLFVCRPVRRSPGDLWSDRPEPEATHRPGYRARSGDDHRRRLRVFLPASPPGPRAEGRPAVFSETGIRAVRERVAGGPTGPTVSRQIAVGRIGGCRPGPV